MNASELVKTFEKANKRIHLLGSLDLGVLIALDMEGRTYTIIDGEVINRVNPAAISGQSNREQYLNPGGDGLWPAPEGTSMGYNYSSGTWRVSPGLTGARYNVTDIANFSVTIEAEIDLITAKGTGIPCIFRRKIQLFFGNPSLLSVCTEETIKYIGINTLIEGEFLISPWSLCQFESGKGCEVKFPCEKPEYVWDLYDDNIGECGIYSNKTYKAIANGSRRYQIGIGEQVPWLELYLPDKRMIVRREASPIPSEHRYIDIRDASPEVLPSENGVRYSVYSDTSNFMEIEAVGGFPKQLLPNAEISLIITNSYQKT